MSNPTMLCRVLLKRLLRGLDEVKLELLLVLGSLGEFLLKCRFCHVLVEAEVLHRHGRERVELAGFGGGIREAFQSSTLDGSHGAVVEGLLLALVPRQGEVDGGLGTDALFLFREHRADLGCMATNCSMVGTAYWILLAIFDPLIVSDKKIITHS